MRTRALQRFRVLLTTMVMLTLAGAAAAQGAGEADDREAQREGQRMETEIEKIQRRVVTQGKVCPDPNRPCDGFKINELSFRIATPFQFDRGRDKSAPFYAVLLKSATRCSITEDERLRVQALFPERKVFVHQYFCQDFGDKVTYTNINEKYGFLAVYAGETDAEARNVLARAKATGQFPDANLRKMEVIIVYQLE